MLGMERVLATVNLQGLHLLVKLRDVPMNTAGHKLCPQKTLCLLHKGCMSISSV